ncbi:MAG: hypothetical protein SF182_25955 [Deltaproteobacteria bacterium]|nr:hypothetical protein [Deltaproteobacteria bacterium]
MSAAQRRTAPAVGAWLLCIITQPGVAAAQFTFTEAGGRILSGQSSSDSASTTIDASGQQAQPENTNIVTMRAAWNVNADAGPGLVSPEIGILSFAVGFILEHPASFNLRLDFNLEGGLLRVADNPECLGSITQADISIATLTRRGAPDVALPIDIVLPGETLELDGNTAGTSLSRQASARLLFRDEPVEATTYVMEIIVSATAISQSCEVSARFGAQNGSTTSCDACGYPGFAERIQERDGLFVTAIFENLCGNATLDPGEDCDLGQTNGAEGTCCDRFCRAASPGSACGDDGNPCTADACTAGGSCVHPLIGGAVCDDTTCVCDNDGLFCNGKVQCGRSGGLCIVLPTPCAEDDTCDEANDTCLTPFGTATPAVNTPTPTPTTVAQACTGDCNGDGMVVVNELVLGVNLALGLQPVSACPAFDANRDASVAVNELVAAVSNTLAGCRP